MYLIITIPEPPLPAKPIVDGVVKFIPPAPEPPPVLAAALQEPAADAPAVPVPQGDAAPAGPVPGPSGGVLA